MTYVFYNCGVEIKYLHFAQDTFKICAESERLILKSAGIKWRQFKTFLTRKYILPFAGQKKKLSKPPKQYAFVGRETWKRFVAARTQDEWKVYNFFYIILSCIFLFLCLLIINGKKCRKFMKHRVKECERGNIHTAHRGRATLV